MPILKPYMHQGLLEAGCDEAGRGPLAGPVYAAAVILPEDFYHPLLNDSKKMSEKARYELRPIIEQQALAWAVEEVSAEDIDRLNILWASVDGMHRALKKLSTRPEFVLVDGNRFKPYQDLPHQTIVKGDGKFLSIAAASILAKTYRDDRMHELHEQYPFYDWIHNAGYPTLRHRQGILSHGLTPHHRLTFGGLGEPTLPFAEEEEPR